MSVLHRFSRTELLIGTSGLQRLKQSHVAVFGLGGVGSYAAEALCRSGIGKITLVDFDDICITNLNRQLHATSTTIGQSKVHTMAERCRQISPESEIVAHSMFFDAESSADLLGERYDYVVDAIDHITAKIHLLVSCREQGIPVIASMGAAAKLDSTKVLVADIADTHTCRMARIIRKLLKKKGVTSGVKVVFSTEEYQAPSDIPSGGCRDNCVCPNKDTQRFSCRHRRVILGSSAHVPGIFGLTMAGEVIRDLLL